MDRMGWKIEISQKICKMNSIPRPKSESSSIRKSLMCSKTRSGRDEWKITNDSLLMWKRILPFESVVGYGGVWI